VTRRRNKGPFAPLGERPSGRNKTVIRATVAISSLLAVIAVPFMDVSVCHADIYRYVDENGVIHLTNVPMHGKFRLWLREAKPGRTARNSSRSVRPENADFNSLIIKAADMHGIDSALIKAVIKAESDFDHLAVSRAGAMGLMQLMPGTADSYRVDDTFDPWSNIDGGVRYLKYLLDQYRGNLPLALAAYNAGEASVSKYNNRIPPYQETQTYVRRVLNYLKQYRNQSRNFQDE